MAHLIMIIRHGEKASPQGGTVSVDRSGHPDETSLSVQGWTRAGALVGFFAWPSIDAIQVPRQIYATQATHQHPSRRTALTVEPLAARLGLQVDARFELHEVEPLWQQLQAEEGPVLVCWEHKAIISLVNLIMGSDIQTPQHWPEDRYDVVWRFERAGGGPWRFDQVPERLLPGDAASAIVK